MGNRVPLCSRLAVHFVCIVGTAGVLMASLSCGSSSETLTRPSASKCGVQAQADQPAFPSSGGSGTLRITTNRECPWSVTSEAGWLSLSTPREGQGEGSVPFTIAANGDPAARTAGVRVNDQQVQVSQEGKPCEFAISSRHEVLDGSGGERAIEVKPSSSLCEWTAATDESWISIRSGRQGKGQGTVTVHIDPIASSSRAGTLTIAGIGVRIEQSAAPAPGPGPGPGPAPGPTPGPSCALSIAPATIGLGPSGGGGEVRVTAPAGCAWTAESQATWITIATGAAGNGPGSVSLRVEATEGPPRTGRVTIGGQIATIEQSSGCTFAVNPTAYTAPAAGGPSTITVTANAGCIWSAASATSWITITGRTGDNGPGRVDFSVAASTGPERTGTLTIAGRAIAVRQASGCTFAVSPSTHNAPGAGGTVSVTVSTAAGCPWQTSSGADWMTPTPATATGSGQAQIAIAANASPARTDTVTIAGQIVTVHQDSQCTYTVLPPSSSYDANGGTGALLVIVSGPCRWTAASSAGWIGIDESRSSGTGDGLVQFTVVTNTGSSRTGTITIAGQRHTVTQAGKTP